MTEDAASAYFDSLADLDVDILAQALNRVTETSKAFPTPAHVLESASQIRRAQGPVMRRFCHVCDRTGFVYVANGVKPCKCRAWTAPLASGPDRAVEGGLRRIGEGVVL